MSAETESGADPSAEIEGFHDRIRRINQASHEGRWNDVIEMLDGAKSQALKRRAELAKRGDLDV